MLLGTVVVASVCAAERAVNDRLTGTSRDIDGWADDRSTDEFHLDPRTALDTRRRRCGRVQRANRRDPATVATGAVGHFCDRHGDHIDR